jgi:hypothetical protein
MRNSVKLSTLSVPAIVLFAAATSCFAQTQVADTRSETPSAVTVAGSEFSLALNRTQPVNIERSVSDVKGSSVPKVASTSKTLNAAAFSATTRFTSVDTNRIYGEALKMSASLPSSINKKEGPSRVEFVASRGQKLPDEQ